MTLTEVVTNLQRADSVATHMHAISASLLTGLRELSFNRITVSDNQGVLYEVKSWCEAIGLVVSDDPSEDGKIIVEFE